MKRERERKKNLCARVDKIRKIEELVCGAQRKKVLKVQSWFHFTIYFFALQKITVREWERRIENVKIMMRENTLRRARWKNWIALNGKSRRFDFFNCASNITEYRRKFQIRQFESRKNAISFHCTPKSSRLIIVSMSMCVCLDPPLRRVRWLHFAEHSGKTEWR